MVTLPTTVTTVALVSADRHEQSDAHSGTHPDC